MAAKSDKPTRRNAAIYFLLQLPGQVFFILLLVSFRKWMEIPSYLMWGLPALWILKDVLLFPVLWRYYAFDPNPDPSRMIGRKGHALSHLAPDGHVHVQGERWRASVAEDSPFIEKGEAVCVHALNGLRLIVRKCDAE